MDAGHPLDQQLAALVRHMQPVDGLACFECEVVTQNADGTVDVRPASDVLGVGLSSVPVALIGPFSVKVMPGAKCLVAFRDGQQDKPVVFSYVSATYTEVTLDAQQIKIGPSASSIKLGKGLKPVAATGDSTDLAANGKPSIIGVGAGAVVNTVVLV
jgi:hypothetical protein